MIVYRCARAISCDIPLELTIKGYGSVGLRRSAARVAEYRLEQGGGTSQVLSERDRPPNSDPY